VRRLWLSSVVLLAALVLDARPAGACSCAARSEGDAFAAADVVFRGDVVGHEGPEGGDVVSSAAPVTWTFRVREVLRGEATATQPVLSEWAGMSCGLELSLDARDVYVFATYEGSRAVPTGRGELYAGLCGGTRPVGDDPLELGVRTAPIAAPSPRDDPAPIDARIAPIAVVSAGVLALVVAAVRR